MAFPVKKDLAIYRGDKFPFMFSIKDDAGEYMDKTGYTPSAQIRASVDDEAVVAEFVAELLDQVVAPGGVTLLLTGADTAVIPPGNYVWDVQLVNDADPTDVTTYFAGAVTVAGDVTR